MTSGMLFRSVGLRHSIRKIVTTGNVTIRLSTPSMMSFFFFFETSFDLPTILAPPVLVSESCHTIHPVPCEVDSDLPRLG